MWSLYAFVTATDFHCTPVDDLIEHSLDEDCVCLPKVKPIELDDASIYFYYQHSALDDRPQER